MLDNSPTIKNQDGNILFIILIAIVLIGALSAAIQGTGQHNANIDKETLILRLSETRSYASELERGVTYIMQNGKSESDIRFSHPNANADYGDFSADPDTTYQIFARNGGAAHYRSPPENVNDGSAWEFYGNTALPEVGSSEAELIALLPNVTSDFCDLVNKTVGYATLPQDSATCINSGSSARFNNSTQFVSSPNTTTETSFSIKPAMQGCIQCTSNGSLHFFHVLMAR